MSNVPPKGIIAIRTVSIRLILSEEKVIQYTLVPRDFVRTYLCLIDSFSRRVEFRERCGLDDDPEVDKGGGGGTGGG